MKSPEEGSQFGRTLLTYCSDSARVESSMPGYDTNKHLFSNLLLVIITRDEVTIGRLWLKIEQHADTVL